MKVTENKEERTLRKVLNLSEVPELHFQKRKDGKEGTYISPRMVSIYYRFINGKWNAMIATLTGRIVDNDIFTNQEDTEVLFFRKMSEPVPSWVAYLADSYNPDNVNTRK